MFFLRTQVLESDNDMTIDRDLEHLYHEVPSLKDEDIFNLLSGKTKEIQLKSCNCEITLNDQNQINQRFEKRDTKILSNYTMKNIFLLEGSDFYFPGRNVACISLTAHFDHLSIAELYALYMKPLDNVQNIQLD
jgi:hypothetical protein